jgi:hypothetical protein
MLLIGSFAAKCKAVRPHVSLALTFAPFPMRNFAMSSFLALESVKCRGVLPQTSAALTFARFSMRSFVMSSLLAVESAKCRDVLPLTSVAEAFAPRLIRSNAIESLPYSTATWSGIGLFFDGGEAFAFSVHKRLFKTIVCPRNAA